MKTIRYLYIGLFDGHGGPGAAIKASKELHQIVHEGLEDVVNYLIQSDDEDHYCSNSDSDINKKHLLSQQGKNNEQQTICKNTCKLFYSSS